MLQLELDSVDRYVSVPCPVARITSTAMPAELVTRLHVLLLVPPAVPDEQPSQVWGTPAGMAVIVDPHDQEGLILEEVCNDKLNIQESSHILNISFGKETLQFGGIGLNRFVSVLCTFTSKCCDSMMLRPVGGSHSFSQTTCIFRVFCFLARNQEKHLCTSKGAFIFVRMPKYSRPADQHGPVHCRIIWRLEFIQRQSASEHSCIHEGVGVLVCEGRVLVAGPAGPGESEGPPHALF